ncbi:MAG: hypothetical protein JSU75_11275 [Gammaproteobacteria bacterium]|nr:MAG: hypothetical protein JSU75_11275 [Gammaproteobacteria bacterium]
MTNPEDLVLDEDGVPILTDVVLSEQEFGTDHIPDNQLAHMSVEDITQTILGSESIRHRLDDIAAELTRNVRIQLEQLLRPAIEQAVTEVMDDSGSAAFEAIRQQLDNALPEILADVLHDETPGNS